MQKVAVIGCGVIGLTTALAIQEHLKQVEVIIFTEKVSPNTTGDVAAGLWEPYLCQNTPKNKVLLWSRETLEYILKLWKAGLAKEAGICLQPVINLSVEPDFVPPEWLEITLGHSFLPKDVLEKQGNDLGLTLTAGFVFTSFTWEASKFLPFLQKQFLRNGGTIQYEKVEDFKDLVGFDVIVNCTGLGAASLVEDDLLQPIRGQVARIQAPWQKHIVLIDTEKPTYVIPNQDCVIIGGTKQASFDLNVSKEDKEHIIQSCGKILRSEVDVEQDQVGLRPGRVQVRLEAETVMGDGGPFINLVHNYGHGGSGITLCMGCAKEAAFLVKEFVKKCKL